MPFQINKIEDIQRILYQATLKQVEMQIEY